MPWREKKYHCGGHSWRGGLFTKQLKKWVKAVFLLGCYGCIFHGTGNSGGWTPQTPSGTPLLPTTEWSDAGKNVTFYFYPLPMLIKHKATPSLPPLYLKNTVLTPIRVTYPTHPTVVDLHTIITFCQKSELWSYSLLTNFFFPLTIN
jgi:hypothetical protein